jgi:hypothetical protein
MSIHISQYLALKFIFLYSSSKKNGNGISKFLKPNKSKSDPKIILITYQDSYRNNPLSAPTHSIKVLNSKKKYQI